MCEFCGRGVAREAGQPISAFKLSSGRTAAGWLASQIKSPSSLSVDKTGGGERDK